MPWSSCKGILIFLVFLSGKIIQWSYIFQKEERLRKTTSWKNRYSKISISWKQILNWCICIIFCFTNVSEHNAKEKKQWKWLWNINTILNSIVRSKWCINYWARQVIEKMLYPTLKESKNNNLLLSLMKKKKKKVTSTSVVEKRHFY